MGTCCQWLQVEKCAENGPTSLGYSSAISSRSLLSGIGTLPNSCNSRLRRSLLTVESEFIIRAPNSGCATVSRSGPLATLRGVDELFKIHRDAIRVVIVGNYFFELMTGVAAKVTLIVNLSSGV